MMKKLLLSLVVALVLLPDLSAKNAIIYLRYDVVSSRSRNIEDELWHILDDVDTCILFYDQQFYVNDEIPTLMNNTSFLRFEVPYEPIEEADMFNAYVSSYLRETIDVKNVGLSGKNDENWMFYFVASAESDISTFIRLVKASEFDKRKITYRFLIYDDARVSWRDNDKIMK